MEVWIVATIVAFYIKGLCGFANTLVFTSILGYASNNVNISPVELVLGYPTNVILAWKHRKELEKKVYLPLSILVLLGSLPGAFLLKNVNASAIKVVFGVVVVLIAIEMIVREYSKKEVKESKILLLLIGIVSGVLCGMFGIGALLAAYVGRVSETSTHFKANISLVFMVENAFRLILYTSLGVITLETLKQSVILMPFMLLALLAGIKSSQIINEKYAKQLVMILLIISGIVLIIKNI